MSIVSPLLSFMVQYPVTNPGARDTRGTSCWRGASAAASGSLTVTLTTTACMVFLPVVESGGLCSGRRPAEEGRDDRYLVGNAAALWRRSAAGSTVTVVCSANRAADSGSWEGR
jgi:hypothetical protein